MLAFSLHPFCWDVPKLSIEINLCPTEYQKPQRAHKVKSCHSIRQRVGTERLDITSERIRFGNSSGRSVGIFCFLWLLKSHTNARCRVSINQPSINCINHNFVNALYQTANGFKCSTGFDWLQCFNKRSGFNFLNRNLANGRENVFLKRTPNILSIILRNAFAFKLKPVCGHN